jgi:hemerythrin-like domain-containing protein
METILKPLKRSTYLAPLSREHHETLLFTWKIKQGLNLKIDLERIISFCNWFFENHMKDHFKKEESALTKILPANDVMIERMVDDHEAIKEKIIDLNKWPTDDGLTRLAQIINYHVRFEERQLFEHIERTATEEHLKTLVTDLEDNRQPAKWNDEFWLNKAASSKNA